MGSDRGLGLFCHRQEAGAGDKGHELGRGALEELWPIPHATSHFWAAPSHAGHLLGNCELCSRFPRGAKINNCAVLLPASMIKLLIRSSNYSALLIHPLSYDFNYPTQVVVGLGLVRLSAAQGLDAGGVLGCLCLGVLAGVPVHRGEMLALGTGPWCPPSVAGMPWLTQTPGAMGPRRGWPHPRGGSGLHEPGIFGELGFGGCRSGRGREGGAAQKRHHMGRKCQRTARSHAGVSAHAITLHEDQGAPGRAGGPTASPELCWASSRGCGQS